MPTAYAGRITFIVAVLYFAFISVYPRAPFSLFLPLTDESASFEHNLRPGIDMVGGTSLTYEIEPPAGAEPDPDLAENVAAALKRRVDPNGVLNLVWRPQGATRLEIQLPLSGDNSEANRARDAYQLAQSEVESFIVAPRQVVRVIEETTGEERADRLAELAGGGESRLAVFEAVAEAYDAFKAAEAAGVVALKVAAEREYELAKDQLSATNITVEEVQAAVAAEDSEDRVDELVAASAGFEERAIAIRRYAEAAERFEGLREEIADTASLKRLLRGSGVLSFHILATDVDPQRLAEMRERLATQGPRLRAGDELRWFRAARDEGETYPTATVGPDGEVYLLAWVTDERSLDDGDPEWGLTGARQTQDERGLMAVSFSFDAMGGDLFGDLSGSNIGRPLAIVLDDAIISAPNLNSRITANGIITGGETGFTNAEVTYLVNTLNAGALPAKLSEDPISERTVGPQLGRANLRAGLMACIVGIGIVGFFLIGYYYLSGVVAFSAVLMNMLIILASMALLQASFTLPSIAGIILSLGMSVDANVLIYERLREEQARGLSIRMALRNAYDRAFSAILDSNVTTGITALILYIFGSEEVKGFGLTLLIGIFASLFTALFVTKTIFGLLVDKVGIEDLRSIPRTFPKWNALLTPKIDWMRWAPTFGGLSAIVIVGGVSLFAYFFVQGRVLDIEFAGGTTAQFELGDPMPAEEVRAKLEREGATDTLAGAQVVSIEPPAGGRLDTLYEVVVPNQDDEAVTAAIISRMGDILQLRQPATFAAAEQNYDQAEDVAAFPITDETEDLAGLPVDPDLLAQASGGVAYVLENLSPPLTADELEERVRAQRLRGNYDGEGLRGGVTVLAETFPAQDSAVILLSNARFPYDPDQVDDWRNELADPGWELITAAVGDPEELQKVTNIGAQVAGEFKRDATIAIILSVFAIMGYIWIRFGDLKYSTATVVALAHDTLFVVAAMGYAHLLADNFFGHLLLLDPFRLNLTMVAAILTVMGFSMNDTVVVFDRIRENRGKYGLLTRGVVNDSINQTLSRTLLTGGTTLVTIFVMYVFGGPGIHGFTFAMLVGIVTGTFSSIAIASPILLLGRQPQVSPERPPAATPATV
jgi:SecD/SecF fusion protein